jgi:hypothetical protein
MPGLALRIHVLSSRGKQAWMAARAKLASPDSIILSTAEYGVRARR